MSVKATDSTTKTANTLSTLAYALALFGGLGFIVGFFTLMLGEGEAAISTVFFFGGGFAATTGLLIITVQSCTMLIIREMWAIERGRDEA